MLSRTSLTPTIIYPYIGDVLYATMMFFIVAFIKPSFSIAKLLVYSVAICFLIEFSQLLQPDWLVNLRKHKIVALVLGQGFLWVDLLCYVIGGLLAMLLHLFVFKKPE